MKNVPTDPNLWAQVIDLAKGNRKKPLSKGGKTIQPVRGGEGFKKYPSAYANGWASKVYKELGGKWKKEGSEFKLPRKWDKDYCEEKPCDEMGFSEKASCRPYKNCYSKTGASPIRIDKAPLLARTTLAWDKIISYAEKAQEQGKSTISKVIKPVPAFELPPLEIGGQKVDLYVVVKKNSDLAKGEFNRSDNSITINISDYSTAILNALAKKYANFEGNFKKSFLSTLSHEVTHAYERILYTLSGGGGHPNDLVSFKRYINSPSEVKAHLQQVAFEAEEYLVAKHSLTREAIRDHFREALSHRGSKWNEISHLLTPRNKKYMERATLTHLLERADMGMRSASEKEAGLITPPQDLLDEVTEIAQGALAEHLFFLRTLPTTYTEKEVDLLEAFSDAFSYLPKGIKRGEEELEDIQLLIMNAKNFLKRFEKKADSSHIPLIKEALKEVSSYDPPSVLELFEVYKDSVKKVSNIFFRIHAEASSNLKGLILESAEADYEKALQKNSHRPKFFKGGYKWRVDHPYLSFPLHVTIEWKQGLQAKGSYYFGTKAHVITFYFGVEKGTWGSHDLKKVRDVARHELVHLVQKEIALKANLIKPSAYGTEYMDTGMPRKKYDSEYRQPNMFNAKQVAEREEQLKSLREQYRREGFDPRLISIHALDDIEFYTRLLDEIMDFRDNYPSPPDNKSIQRFINLSQFFRSLKRYKPRNWKKAVGLFYEAVNKESL